MKNLKKVSHLNLQSKQLKKRQISPDQLKKIKGGIVIIGDIAVI